MGGNTRTYLWQQPGWTDFQYESSALLEVHGQCRYEQGLLRAQLEALGLEERLEAQAEVLVEEAMKTSEIEGVNLDRQQVRSSVARRLGLPDAGLRQPERNVESLVQILLDATQSYAAPLTAERLKGWQAALFPTGYSGIHQIIVGDWRQGMMQVVSGPAGRGKLHFEAPPAGQLDGEVQHLLNWWNAPPQSKIRGHNIDLSLFRNIRNANLSSWPAYPDLSFPAIPTTSHNEASVETDRLVAKAALPEMVDGWASFLQRRDGEAQERIMKATRTGRPVGGDDFVSQLEALSGRHALLGDRERKNRYYVPLLARMIGIMGRTLSN